MKKTIRCIDWSNVDFMIKKLNPYKVYVGIREDWIDTADCAYFNGEKHEGYSMGTFYTEKDTPWAEYFDEKGNIIYSSSCYICCDDFSGYEKAYAHHMLWNEI